MAHHLYMTRGYVLRSASFGEADKLFSIFTEELGLLQASAKSVRAIRSKLRFHLDDLSVLILSLVKGKSRWKITNAVSTENLWKTFASEKGKRALLTRIFSLIGKLLTGEEADRELFSLIGSGVEFLKSEHFTAAELKAIECLWVANILRILGYVDASKIAGGQTTSEGFSKEMVKNSVCDTRKLVSLINEGLEAAK